MSQSWPERAAKGASNRPVTADSESEPTPCQSPPDTDQSTSAPRQPDKPDAATQKPSPPTPPIAVGSSNMSNVVGGTGTTGADSTRPGEPASTGSEPSSGQASHTSLTIIPSMSRRTTRHICCCPDICSRSPTVSPSHRQPRAISSVSAAASVRRSSLSASVRACAAVALRLPPNRSRRPGLSRSDCWLPGR